MSARILSDAELQRLEDLSAAHVQGRGLPVVPTAQGLAVVELCRSVESLLYMLRMERAEESRRLGLVTIDREGTQAAPLDVAEAFKAAWMRVLTADATRGLRLTLPPAPRFRTLLVWSADSPAPVLLAVPEYVADDPSHAWWWSL